MRFWILSAIYSGMLTGIFFVDAGIQNLWVPVALITVVYSIIVVLGVSIIRLNLFIKSLSSFKTSENEIALTFDDGPDNELTLKVLDLLKEYKAKATFFCIGNKVEDNEPILKRMLAEGHSIGNHTWEHANSFPWWSVKRITDSIAKTDNALKAIGIEKCTIFRPPFGVTNNLIAAAIKRSNKKCVGWSIRTKDTCKSIEEVVDKVKRNIKPGDIVLLHDTNKNILTELKEILDFCNQKGLKSVAIN
ncbi:polysaccharide deacetylase family protein [Plebeiibacterium marinum]|uniref:Polysaccharide deacetylase family protein n=1 Tax=Plebeiibacterium marinum TaxID=2992111 RepID=A0AAE3MEC9_9BACT|nr:polysaccharide deacetylase family protein [Plebeiobacterium marinum]MCW3806052.1 polysaccharide deacetylase family protein [Plebeiobacterium marinum]